MKGQSVAGAFKGVIDPQESLADGIGGGYGVIGYKGKEWSLRYKGENYRFTDLVKGREQAATSIDVIIVRQAPGKSKSYFPSYEEGSSGRPLCQSIDGITPDEDVDEKQSDSCAICPRNVFQTNSKGFRSKECSDYKRVAVLLMPDVSKKMLGAELQEAVFLRVPAASLTNLGTYGEYLKRIDAPYLGLVTRISFEQGKAFPKFQFFGEAFLPEDVAPFVLQVREDHLTKRITGEDGSYRVKQIGQQAAPEQIEKPKTVAKVSFSSNGSQSIGQTGPIGQGQASSGSEGVGRAPKQIELQANPETTQNVKSPAADEGKDVEESDADLDARLGSLIKF